MLNRNTIRIIWIIISAIVAISMVGFLALPALL